MGTIISFNAAGTLNHSSTGALELRNLYYGIVQFRFASGVAKTAGNAAELRTSPRGNPPWFPISFLKDERVKQSLSLTYVTVVARCLFPFYFKLTNQFWIKSKVYPMIQQPWPNAAARTAIFEAGLNSHHNGWPRPDTAEEQLVLPISKNLQAK